MFRDGGGDETKVSKTEVCIDGVGNGRNAGKAEVYRNEGCNEVSSHNGSTGRNGVEFSGGMVKYVGECCERFLEWALRYYHERV